MRKQQEKGTVVVLGATGGTGYRIVQELRRQGTSVRVLSREREKTQSLLGDAVEIAVADVTAAKSLRGPFADAEAVIVTVGVKPGRVPESTIKAVEYEGTINILEAAQADGFAGRVLYMGAIGTDAWSPASGLLNVIKGNTLKWRRRAEQHIRDSALDYTIIHAGVLSHQSKPHRPLRISQRSLRMWPWRRVGRHDIAQVFVQALRHPNTRNATFDAVWGSERDRGPLAAKFERLIPDSQRHDLT